MTRIDGGPVGVPGVSAAVAAPPSPTWFGRWVLRDVTAGSRSVLPNGLQGL
jgi:hypothetical protein